MPQYRDPSLLATMHPARERSASSEVLREDREVWRVRGREMDVSHILLDFQLGARNLSLFPPKRYFTHATVEAHNLCSGVGGQRQRFPEEMPHEASVLQRLISAISAWIMQVWFDATAGLLAFMAPLRLRFIVGLSLQ